MASRACGVQAVSMLPQLIDNTCGRRTLSNTASFKAFARLCVLFFAKYTVMRAVGSSAATICRSSATS